MPVNDFSIGRDLTFTLVLPSGPVTINGLTSYNKTPKFTDLNHKGLNGENVHAEIPDGWEIKISLDRKSKVLDDLFAALEAQYFAGANIQSGTMTETIRESDGSISQYQYTKCVVKFDAAGDFKGDSLIPQSMTVLASRRIKRA